MDSFITRDRAMMVADLERLIHLLGRGRGEALRELKRRKERIRKMRKSGAPAHEVAFAVDEHDIDRAMVDRARGQPHLLKALKKALAHFKDGEGPIKFLVEPEAAELLAKPEEACGVRAAGRA